MKCIKAIFIYVAVLISSTENVFSKEPVVAILGESASIEGSFKTGVNTDVVKSLFGLIKKENPDAVFFLGNLTMGMAGFSSKSIPHLRPLEQPSFASRYAEWKKLGFFYSSEEYKRQLDIFKNLMNEQLGEKIPFYPVMGIHETVGSDSEKIFQSKFGLKKEYVEGEHSFVYTVSIGDACFIVVSITFYDPEQNHPEEGLFSEKMLLWLDKTLKEKSMTHRYLYVMGNEPAFSTTASEGKYRGLDEHINVRDQFWKILKDNSVLAYFCSDEHLYDRSLRQGVWQITTGGAGAPLDKKDVTKAFYHYILLSIPSNREQNPIIKVIDVDGKIRDEFELNTGKHPIYELRISKEA